MPGVPDLTEHARAWPHVFAFARERRSPRSDAATANCTRPFSRGLFGFTPFSDLRADGVTPAHRLALGVISSDPLASLPWGDRPMPDRPAHETEFLRRTPTVWQDTQVLAGTTERTVALARRSGEDWFVGAINGSDAHKLALALAFLDPGRAYLAHLHTDDPAALPAPRTVYSFRKVFSTDRLELSLAATGGAAIWLTPDSKRR